MFIASTGCASNGNSDSGGTQNQPFSNGSAYSSNGGSGNSASGGDSSGNGDTSGGNDGVGSGGFDTSSGGAGDNGSGSGGDSNPGSGGGTGFGSGGDSNGSGGDTGSGGVGDGGAGSGSGGSGGIPHGSCLDGITNYEADGPFTVTTKTVAPINFYVPSVPAGCKVPVVHLANGTGAVCADYQPALQRLATHGFLAACYENANTGAGDQGLQALTTALSTFPDLADMKFGSTGHSQGGQAAFTVLALAEKKYGTSMIYAGLAMEPASGFGTQPTTGTWQTVYASITSPMFMFSGLNTDGLVSQAWVQEAYDATSKSEEAYFWTANGATHIPVPNGQEEEISVPWFRWKLLGDQKACAFFKAIPTTDTKWAQVAAKNSVACQ